jgi:hypothetical protein
MFGSLNYLLGVQFLTIGYRGQKGNSSCRYTSLLLAPLNVESIPCIGVHWEAVVIMVYSTYTSSGRCNQKQLDLCGI